MKENNVYRPIKKYIVASRVYFKSTDYEYLDAGIYNTLKEAIQDIKRIKKLYFENTKAQFKIKKVTFYERINY